MSIATCSQWPFISIDWTKRVTFRPRTSWSSRTARKWNWWITRYNKRLPFKLFDAQSGPITWPWCLHLPSLFVSFILSSFAYLSFEAVFPGVVSSYKSVNFEEGNDYYEKYFTTIWVFLNFNVFDFLGRYLSEKACDENSPFNVIKQNEVCA